MGSASSLRPNASSTAAASVSEAVHAFGRLPSKTALGPNACTGEYQDLCERLEHLEATSGGAPLICITHTEQLTHHESLSDVWEPDELGDTETGSSDGDEECAQAAPDRGDPDAAESTPPPADAEAPEARTPADDSLASQPSIIGGFEAITPPQEPGAQLERPSPRPLSSARSGWEVL